MSLTKVLDVARGEVGVTESPPGSNRIKYWDDYDSRMQGQPWCVAFLYSVFLHAGERMAFFGGGKTASCSMLLRWYREQGLVVPVSEVQPGDIVLLNFNGKGTPDHCGLVVEVFNNWHFQTIEGNTTPGYEGIQDNGGCVAKKLRYEYQAVAICRPQYKEEEAMKDDLTDHWAEKSCRKAEQKAIMKGFTDGSWRPDEPPTRAQIAVILDRLGLLD